MMIVSKSTGLLAVKAFFTLLFFFLLSAPLAAQNFTQDVDGYSYRASASGADVETTIRAAKAVGIDGIFDQLGKDELFRNIFISSWPQFITVEEQEIDDSGEDGDQRYTVSMVIRIPVNPIQLTQNSYSQQAALILDQAEELLANAGQLAPQGARAEQNLDATTAMNVTQQQQRFLREAENLLRPLGDNGLLSSEGTSLATIRQLLVGLQQNTAETMERLEVMAEQAAFDENQNQIRNTLNLIAKQGEEYIALSETLSIYSPFYDMAPSVLEDYKSQGEQAVSQSEELLQRLEELEASISTEEIYLLQQLDFVASDLELSLELLNRYLREIRAELRYPRLRRQADAEAAARFWEGVGSAMEWFFLRTPSEIVSLRWRPNLNFSHPDFEVDRQTGDLEIGVGGLLEGVWLGTSVKRGYGTLPLGNLVPTPIDLGHWSQEVYLGFYRNLLVGAGFTWDWNRDAGTSERDPMELPESYAIAINLGSVNQDEAYIPFLATLRYRIPPVEVDGAVIGYHLNGELELRGNLARTIGLRVRAKAHWVQIGNVTGPGPSSDWEQDFAFTSGVGIELSLRLPPPFEIGVSFNVNRMSPFVDNLVSDSGAVNSTGWGLVFGYSF